MSESLDKLQSMVSLAGETSSERRRDLLRGITDIFLEDADGHSDSARDQFGGLMGDIAYSLEMDVRRTLAGKLANLPGAPRDLVQRLAEDAIDVARPVLEQSPLLSDDDLAGIAERHGGEHVHAMAGREKISEALSETIVSHGADDAVVRLVSNEDAAISRRTLERVVERSEDSKVLQAPLVRRQNLPPDVVSELFWRVSGELRAEVLERTNNIDPAELERALEEARAELGGDAGPQVLPPEAEEFADMKAARDELGEALLVRLLRDGEMDKFFACFRKMADVDLGTLRRIFADRTGQALAISTKACGFARSTFSTFVLMTDPQGERRLGDTYALLALYDEMAAEVAQRTMRFWRVRQRAMEGGAPDSGEAEPTRQRA